KDTFDGLVKDYSKYLNQINGKIAENSEIVSNFEKIQKIR
ncbi:adhesion protein FadA, partial [Fusobacterium nucleatum]